MFIRLVVKNFLESKTLTSCLFVLAYWSSGAPRGDIFFPRWRRALPAAGNQIAWGLQSVPPTSWYELHSELASEQLLHWGWESADGPIGRGRAWAGAGGGNDSCEWDMKTWPKISWKVQRYVLRYVCGKKRNAEISKRYAKICLIQTNIYQHIFIHMSMYPLNVQRYV